MNNTLRSITVLIMALSFLIACASCANNSDSGKNTLGSSGGSGDSVEISGDDTSVNDSYGLPSDLNYNNATISIFHRAGSGFDEEFECDAESSDLVDIAVYKRNRAVEEKLKVKLSYTGMQWHATNYNATILSSVRSGDNEYDIFSGPAYHIPILMTDGCYADLSETKYLDFDKVWWANGINDGMAIDGKIFVTTGDISLGYVKYLHCLIFNEDMYHDIYGEDTSLYEIVKNGEWTVEKMAEITNGVWSDEDRSNDKSEGDKFGYVLPNTNLMRAYIDAINLNIIQIDENGDAVLWNENQSHIHDAIETMNDYFSSKDVFYTKGDESNQRSYTIFKEGRTMFVLGRLTDISSTYRDVSEFTYGVVPLPKWDENDEYGVTICGSESVFAICSSLSDSNITRASAVMEALAYESYYNVTPVYYENALKIKYDMQNDKAIMLDLIKDGATFNPNVQLNKLITNGDLSDPTKSLDYSVCYAMLYEPTWMALYDSSKTAWQTALESLTDIIRNIET